MYKLCRHTKIIYNVHNYFITEYIKFQNCPVNFADRQFWGPGLLALALFLYSKISIHNLQVPPRDPTKKFKSSYPICLYLLRVLPYGNHYVKLHQVKIIFINFIIKKYFTIIKKIKN